MGMFLDVSDFGSNVEDVADLIIEVEGKAALKAPLSLLPVGEDQWALARGVLRRALSRWIAQGYTGTKSQTAGPWSATYDTAPGELSASEVDTLQALCALVAPVSGAGLPRGSFPAVANYNGLFASPGR